MIHLMDKEINVHLIFNEQRDECIYLCSMNKGFFNAPICQRGSPTKYNRPPYDLVKCG